MQQQRLDLAPEPPTAAEARAWLERRGWRFSPSRPGRVRAERGDEWYECSEAELPWWAMGEGWTAE